MSESLKSLSGNEQPWANHSGRSRQMSNCEQFSQVAHDKWANERFAQKIWLNKSKILFFSMFYIRFFLFTMWVKCSRCSPKMSDVSESLRTLTKNERPWAICSDPSEEMSENERIAQVVRQKWANEWIARFFSESLIRSFSGKKRAKPMSKFPALHVLLISTFNILL